ncbi:unnamed protein product, partial [Polarella glacialis]
ARQFADFPGTDQGAVAQDVGRALEAVLAYFGWQHLDVQYLGYGAAGSFGAAAVSVSGTIISVRLDGSCSLAASPSSAERPPYRLLASDDGGSGWEALEALIRRRRLQKVVRTAPIATGTVEFAVEQPTLN